MLVLSRRSSCRRRGLRVHAAHPDVDGACPGLVGANVDGRAAVVNTGVCPPATAVKLSHARRQHCSAQGLQHRDCDATHAAAWALGGQKRPRGRKDADVGRKGNRRLRVQQAPRRHRRVHVAQQGRPHRVGGSRHGVGGFAEQGDAVLQVPSPRRQHRVVCIPRGAQHRPHPGQRDAGGCSPEEDGREVGRRSQESGGHLRHPPRHMETHRHGHRQGGAQPGRHPHQGGGLRPLRLATRQREGRQSELAGNQADSAGCKEQVHGTLPLRRRARREGQRPGCGHVGGVRQRGEEQCHQRPPRGSAAAAQPRAQHRRRGACQGDRTGGVNNGGGRCAVGVIVRCG